MDHAATGWPKHPAVADAMSDYINHVGAAAGRGLYASAETADRIVADLRRTIASMVGSGQPDNISLHPSGTAALNAAILGLVRAGDHVVTTAAEHNSVLRVLDHLRATVGVRFDVVPISGDSQIDAHAILTAIQPNTAMVAVTTASNVTGMTLPIDQIGQELRNRNTIFLCDAAQTLGWLPINVDSSGIDVLAAPGHKAAGGPLGTAFLHVDAHLHDRIKPSLFGGTGSQSESLDMPDAMPNKLECGNLNVPALAGWSAGLAALRHGSTPNGFLDRTELAGELSKTLHSIVQRSGFSTTNRPGQIPIVPLWTDQIGASEIAIILASEYGIEARAGLHCAAAIHACIGSPDGGVLRLAAGPETSGEDLQAVADALQELSNSLQ